MTDLLDKLAKAGLDGLRGDSHKPQSTPQASQKDPRRFFSVKETSCRCGCGGDIIEAMLMKINEIREEWGKPLSINSGYRCPAYNKKIGGAPGSAHQAGLAVDFSRTEEFLAFIIKNLEHFNIWIENPLVTTLWCHISIRPVPGKRVFEP